MKKPQADTRRNTRSTARLALWETLESRQMLSASFAPIATPNLVASPLDGTLANGTATPMALSPAQIKAAYGIDKTTLNGIVGDGTGQTIAIITANDAPNLVSSTASNFNSSDLHIFDQQFGLPDPTFTKVEQSPGQMTPDPGWAEEAALDVEWSHAIAPKAKIVLFEASSAGSVQLLNWGAQSAAAYSGVSVVSMSFGFGEFSGENVYDQDFKTPSGHSGVTFVASTGDSGAPGDYPAFSPNVVAIGGTHLNLSGSNYSSESGYGSSGGGISTFESKPSFQSSVSQSSSHRTTPDVSLDGDPSTGVDVYDSYNTGYANKWYKIAGTSFSTPAWAGLIAIANQGRTQAKMSTLDGPSQTLPKLYSLSSSDFHDITSGNNGYPAGSGYDLVTGRGSPIANLLLPALAGVPAGSTTTSGTASIAGEIYTDTNSNGKLDSGEAGISGVKVFIDTNRNGVLDSGEYSVTTASNGIYTFSGLPAGAYEIREITPSGDKLVAPSAGAYIVTVQNSWHVTGENFGNTPISTPATASTSGYIYFDKNNDKKYDSGDYALSGVKLFIDTNKNGKLDSGEAVATSNSSGYYYFGSLKPGVYRVTEIVPSGDHLTNPTNLFYDITVQVGWAIKNENFGNL